MYLRAKQNNFSECLTYSMYSDGEPPYPHAMKNFVAGGVDPRLLSETLFCCLVEKWKIIAFATETASPNSTTPWESNDNCVA